jgi:hypothetical protein
MAEATLRSPPVKDVIVTSHLVTDRLPQEHGPHRRNEKEREREREREGRRVMDLQDHPPASHLVQDLRRVPLLPEDTRPVVVRHLPLVVPPEVGQEIARVATQVNNLVGTSWPARVLETNVNTCMLAEAAVAVLPHAGPLPLRLLRKAALGKAKERANPDHRLLQVYVIFTVGAFARMETNANSNTLNLLLPLRRKDLSPKLEPNLRPQLFEFHGATRQPAWPSVISLTTTMTNIRRSKR